MKIVVTGSLGNVSRPLATELVQRGHEVIVISSTEDRRAAIESLGAKAAIGSMLDVDFLSETFKGADAVYLMEAVDRSKMMIPDFDIIEAYKGIAEGYKQAVINAGVKKAVHLSSLGAHTTEGNGVLSMHYWTEKVLNELPENVAVKFLRPVGFFSNLYRSMHTIKAQGMIISNMGGDKKEPWVAPLDIALAVAHDLENPFENRSFQYIASDKVSPNAIAQALGEAIGNPELKWLQISDEEQLKGMLAFGMNQQAAKGFVEMQAAQREGSLYEHYYAHEPELGKVKLKDFAQEFAKIYQSA